MQQYEGEFQKLKLFPRSKVTLTKFSSSATYHNIENKEKIKIVQQLSRQDNEGNDVVYFKDKNLSMHLFVPFY